MIDLRTLGTITSTYGKVRTIDGVTDTHKGIDIVLKNWNIPFVTDGTVIAKGENHKTMGNYLTVKQSDGTTATYMHMAVPSSWNVGDSVKEGDRVGLMGTTGRSTGVHLHYEVKDSSGAYIDPAEYLGGDFISDMTTTTAGSGDDVGLSIWGKIVKFIVILLLAVCAIYLILKSFDIDII